jgi:RimJ/RimL family protein N-acetyltransferase
MKIIARTVSLDDADLILEWRNSIDARIMSRNTSLISVVEHRNWLNKWLGEENRGYFWIYSEGSKNIGYVRFDSSEKINLFEISIFIEEGNRGQGAAKMLLEDSLARLSDLEKIVTVKATVLKSNLASMRLFYSSGFKLVKTDGPWDELILNLP